MPEDQIEMLWRCSDGSCNNENRGRFKKCERCGRPKTDEDGYYLPGDISHSAAVTDADQLRHAKGGADWFCRFCGTRQFRADKICDNCGVDQAQGVSTSSSTAPVEAPVSWREPVIRPISRFWAWRRAILLGASGLTLLVLFVHLLQPKVVEATVTSVAWRTTVHVELYSKHWHDGFHPPDDAVDVENQAPHIHHYDRVKTGSHQESYEVPEPCGQTCTPVPRTCSTTPRKCRSNKNGYATCTGGDQVCSGGGRSCSTKYCDVTHWRWVDDYISVPQFAPWYTWNSWEWAFEKDLTKNGSDFSPIFEALPPSDTERESGRDFALDVVFTQHDKTVESAVYTYHPSLSEFPHYELGTKRRIKVGAIGGTVEVLP